MPPAWPHPHLPLSYRAPVKFRAQCWAFTTRLAHLKLSGTCAPDVVLPATDEEREMMPSTIGSQFEAERLLAKMRVVSKVGGDPCLVTWRSTRNGRHRHMMQCHTPSARSRHSAGMPRQSNLPLSNMGWWRDAVWLTSELALAFWLVPFVVNSIVTHPSSCPDIGRGVCVLFTCCLINKHTRRMAVWLKLSSLPAGRFG